MAAIAELEESIKKAFTELDVDGSGELDPAEVILDVRPHSP